MIASGVLPLGHPGANPGMLLRRQQMPALHVVQGFHGQPFEAPDTAQRGTVQPSSHHLVTARGRSVLACGLRKSTRSHLTQSETATIECSTRGEADCKRDSMVTEYALANSTIEFVCPAVDWPFSTNMRGRIRWLCILG